ncbi:MAG: hypothetical protein AAF914_06920 [Pseudomonadota bacterium]
MRDTDSQDQAWWFDGLTNDAKFIIPVGAYADYGLGWFANLGALSAEIRRRNTVFTPDHGPECLFINSSRAPRRWDFDDVCVIWSAGIMVSGAMMDLLAGFALGATQLLELPLYEGRPATAPKVLPTTLEPDPTRPVPGRWGLLNVVERKDAISLEHSVNLGVPGISFVPLREKATLVAVHRAIACSGVDPWYDVRDPERTLFLSGRLRDAILGAGLRVPAMKRLRRAVLIDP